MMQNERIRSFPRLIKSRKGTARSLIDAFYVGPLKIPSISSFTALWPSFFGAVFGIGFTLIGIPLPSRTCGVMLVVYLGWLKGCSGLVLQRFVGHCGLLGTSLLLNISFRLTLWATYLNLVSSCSSGDYWVRRRTSRLLMLCHPRCGLRLLPCALGWRRHGCLASLLFWSLLG